MPTTCGSVVACAEERLDGRERIERMVDQVVLLADLVEDALGRDARACQSVRGDERRVLQMRQRQPRQRHPVGEVDAVRRCARRCRLRPRSCRRGCSTIRFGIAASTCRSDGRAVPELLEAPIDRLEQIVGAVFLDLHVGVADDAEEVRARRRRGPGKRLAQIQPHDVLEKREGVAVARHVRAAAG